MRLRGSPEGHLRLCGKGFGRRWLRGLFPRMLFLQGRELLRLPARELTVKQIHAPWRMAYIHEINEQDGCFLCDAAEAPREKWEDLLIIFRDETTVAVLNRFPYNNGHVLVAPLVHQGDLSDLTPEGRSALMETVLKTEDALKKAMAPHGFNIGLNIGAEAGAGIPGHLHFHIVPRWRADTNCMPVIADVKVIPQALSETRGLLFEAMGAAR